MNATITARRVPAHDRDLVLNNPRFTRDDLREATDATAAAMDAFLYTFFHGTDAEQAEPAARLLAANAWEAYVRHAMNVALTLRYTRNTGRAITFGDTGETYTGHLAA